MRTVFVFIAVAALATSACTRLDESPQPSPSPSVTAESTSADAASAASVTSSATATQGASTSPAMPATTPATQREQAARLLMPPVVNFDDALFKLQAGVGGIFIPSWADPRLLTEPGRDLHALREIVGRDFEVSIDFEGGRVQRFTEVFGAFPTPRDMAANNTPQQVEGIGFAVGQSLAARGVTVDFAPVIDVDGAGLDVVGDRSFSTDPVVAADYGVAFARGLEAAGVTAVFKHYPGHGQASGDSHLEEVHTPPLDQLMARDLVAFDRALPAAPDAQVMVGHMIVPGLGDGVTPSSLNNHAYGLLRNHHRFQGVVFTDDLTGMKAISNGWAPQDAIVQAIAAGADQPLWSREVDINVVIDAVDRAVTEGRIHPQRFQAAVQRVCGELDY